MLQELADKDQQIAQLSETLMRLLGGGFPIGPRFDESKNFNHMGLMPRSGGGPPVPPVQIPPGLFRPTAPLVQAPMQGMLAGWPRSRHIG
jgi:hypothetical protein